MNHHEEHEEHEGNHFKAFSHKVASCAVKAYRKLFSGLSNTFLKSLYKLRALRGFQKQNLSATHIS